MKPLPKVQAGGILRTSLDNTWQTPRKILDPADRYFGGRIPLDAASAPTNPTRAERYCCGRVTREIAHAAFRGVDMSYGLGDLEACHPIAEWISAATWDAVAGAWPWVSGLEVSWDWPTWVNPPYGRELKHWLKKIVLEAHRGQEIVSLIPCSRWEQAYFQRLLRAARTVLLIRGRVAFISSIDHVPVQGNPYASMLVGFNVDRARWLESFGALGASFDIRATKRRRRLVISSPESPSLFAALEASRGS